MEPSVADLVRDCEEVRDGVSLADGGAVAETDSDADIVMELETDADADKLALSDVEQL